MTIHFRELNIHGWLCITKNTKIRPHENIPLYGSSSKDYIIQCNSNSNRQPENGCNCNRQGLFCNSNCNRICNML